VIQQTCWLAKIKLLFLVCFTEILIFITFFHLRKTKTDSVVASKGKKKLNEPLSNHSSRQVSKKQNTETTTTVTQNTRLKDSCAKIVPKFKCESELERTIRLRMEKLKESQKKLTKSKNALPESSPRQKSTSQQTLKATSNTSSSQTKLKVKIPFPEKKIKVNSPHVNSSMPQKQKTLMIWKFKDGTTVKKFC
jgi:hypothetical protein